MQVPELHVLFRLRMLPSSIECAEKLCLKPVQHLPALSPASDISGQRAMADDALV